MLKQFLFFTLIGLAVLGGAYFFLERSFSNPFFYPCPFCNQEVLDHQKFYEDDLVYALCTHKPILPGHSLILPKRHVERFEMLTEEEITQIGRVAKKVNQVMEKVFGTSSYLLHQKNGLEVGQSVPHVHFHYIARKKGEDSIFEFLAKIVIAQLKGPISEEEIHYQVEMLKDAMQPLLEN